MTSKHEILVQEGTNEVKKHIRDYVLPQYGDYGEDPAADYDEDDCIKQAQRYMARRGKSSRPGEERRDLLKAIHWLMIGLQKDSIHHLEARKDPLI